MTDMFEQAVEAAAKALYGQGKDGPPWEELSHMAQFHLKEMVLPAVSAAAPILRAGALEEAADAALTYDGTSWLRYVRETDRAIIEQWLKSLANGGPGPDGARAEQEGTP